MLLPRVWFLNRLFMTLSTSSSQHHVRLSCLSIVHEKSEAYQVARGSRLLACMTHPCKPQVLSDPKCEPECLAFALWLQVSQQQRLSPHHSSPITMTLTSPPTFDSTAAAWLWAGPCMSGVGYYCWMHPGRMHPWFVPFQCLTYCAAPIRQHHVQVLQPCSNRRVVLVSEGEQVMLILEN